MPQVLLANRAQIHVSGPDAQHFLHNLVTAAIEGLPHGVWMPGALLTAQGKILFSFLVARDGDGYVLEAAEEDAADFHKRLKFYRLRAKVEISEPEAANIDVAWENGAVDPAALRDGRFPGLEVWRSHTNAPEPVNAEAWTRLRIEHGVAEPHADYVYNDVFPHDINLDQIGGVSFKKGCYVGQEVVSRMQHRATARRRLMAATGESPIAGGAEIKAGGKLAGAIGSVSGKIGMALVRLDRIKDAMDNGGSITAGHALIKLHFPIGVSYGWPAVTETEA
jgi:tRNA-modifying protein YgfZ